MTPKEFKAILDEYLIYLRKSRSDGEKKSVEDVLERHEKQLQDYAIRTFGKKIAEENIYREVVSGGEAIEDRPEFIKVLKRLEVGNIKGVLVIDPQRLSRSGLYGAGDVLEAFEITNTLIVTPAKTYDLQNKMDKKYLEMVMIQSAEYLEYTKEVLNRGRLQSVSEGKYIGSTPPYGYGKEKLIDEKGYKLVPLPEEAKHVIEIFEMCIEGVGTTNIANYLNEHEIKPRKGMHWTPATIRGILTNKTYIGMLTWQKYALTKILVDREVKKKRVEKDKYILVKGLHEPLVTNEQFELAQESLKNNSTGKINNHGIKNPLNGLVRCGICDGAMIRRPYNKSFRKNPVRVYDIDKQELLDYLRSNKERSKLSLSQIAKRLKVSRDIVISWFPTSTKKMHVSQTLADKWFELKELLEINDTKFDKEVTTYKEPDIQDDTLMCITYNCDCVSSRLKDVEDRILLHLEEHLKHVHYYLDNYEQEVKKEVKNNERELKKLNKKIDQLNEDIKEARKSMIRKVISEEEYLELKHEFESEIEPLKKRKAKIEDTKEEEKIISYKKQIPILERCIKDYPILSIEEKNEYLKEIIEKIIYTKTEGGRWNVEARESFTLKLFLNL